SQNLGPSPPSLTGIDACGIIASLRKGEGAVAFHADRIGRSPSSAEVISRHAAGPKVDLLKVCCVYPLRVLVDRDGRVTFVS
ncbi:hypothetical protein, partial [Nocardia salmonicida]|uniref:hypothetical protein n=1 Tax=Nocardia salmonicida TaxID=53431 RepID=UPI003648E7DA